MSRLDIRCKVDLPVSVIMDNNGGKGITETKTKFSSLSLGGGCIDYKPSFSENRIVGLNYDLPR